MTNLYKISQQYSDILEQLEDKELELTTEEIEKYLAPINDAFDKKAISLASYMQNLKSSIDVLKTEEDRLRKKRKSIENKISKLKDYLKNNMEKCGITKIKSDLFDIQLQDNPFKVHVINDDAIPIEYLIITKDINKIAIKDYLQKHGNQEWAELIRDKSVRIK